MMQQTALPLSHLFPDPAVNARTSNAGDGLDEAIASIAAIGVLEPLLCRPGKDGLLVVDGERRRRALEALAARGAFNREAALVPVIIRAMTDDEAREASLAANVVCLALHPIDQFEAFSLQAAAGRTPAEIAVRFGVAERVVRQRIALGALHPDIRAAWRAGRLGADAAQAFTLARDPMDQVAKFIELEKKNNLWASHIRAAFGANHDAGAALRFVGLEAYRAAGGEAVEDLFGGADALSDPGLAQRLANDKMREACKRLVDEEGWSFALPRAEVKKPWSWAKLKPSGKEKLSDAEAGQKALLARIAERMKDADGDGMDFEMLEPDRRAEVEALCAQLEPPIAGEALEETYALIEERNAAIDLAAERSAFGRRQKKSAGCFVDLASNGALQITYGVQKPEEEKKPAKASAGAAPPREADDEEESGEEERADAAASPRDEAGPQISAALCLALSQQRTIAAAKALAADPYLALCAAIAALESHGGGAVKLNANGYHPAAQAVRVEGPGESWKFADKLALLLALDTPERLERLAILVAGALDLQRHHPDAYQRDADALIAALDRDEFEREALGVFDPEAYFRSVNAALCARAADELAVPAKGRPKKKAELAALLAAKAKAEHWLPPELRHPAREAGPTLAQAMDEALDKAAAE